MGPVDSPGGGAGAVLRVSGSAGSMETLLRYFEHEGEPPTLKTDPHAVYLNKVLTSSLMIIPVFLYPALYSCEIIFHFHQTGTGTRCDKRGRDVPLVERQESKYLYNPIKTWIRYDGLVVFKKQ